MRICFYASRNKAHEHALAQQFAAGARKVGDAVTVVNSDESHDGYDCYCIIGVKNLDILNKHRAVNVPVVYFDKAYSRRSNHWRVAINSHQPTDYLNTVLRPGDRATKFGWWFTKWRERGGHILLAGSGRKYHVMKGLGFGDPTQYAREIIKEVRKYSGRSIVYRPKPSWQEAVPIEGTVFSRGKEISRVLLGAHVLITYGSNACFEALLSGIPSIILGDGVTRSISSTSLSDVEKPHLASASACGTLINSLAYCQWTVAELETGAAWRTLRQEVTRTPALFVNT